MITKRIIGILKIILNLMWMAAALMLLIWGQKALVWTENRVNSALDAMLENVILAKTMITETTDVMVAVDDSLSAVETTMIDGALVLIESRPLVDKTSQILVEDVPEAMDEVQKTMPAVIEATRTIEQTLNLLSGFKLILPNPFGDDFQFDLGVEYNPEISLEESLGDLSSSLQPISDQMRILEGDLISADISMGVMSQNLFDLAKSLDKVRETLLDIQAVLAAFDANLEQLQELLGASKSNFPRILSSTRIAIITLTTLLLLTQIPPIYDGYQLLKEDQLERIE